MHAMKKRAVFLDRDGVINQAILHKGKPYSPSNLKELIILPGVPKALERLRKEGFLLIVITNQPDVTRGMQKKEQVEAIHNYLLETLSLDAIYVCYHDDVDVCSCRKPKAGLLLDAADDFNIDLSKSFVIGDRWKDIEAGIRAGCKTLFIEYGYDEKQPKEFWKKAGSLMDCVKEIKWSVSKN